MENEGHDTNRIKNGMVNTLFTSLNLDRAKPSVDMATNTENSFNENHTMKQQCTSYICSALSPKLEGLKLDFVVLEANLNHKIKVMENQILHNNQNSQHAVSNNCCSKRDDTSSTLEVQSFDNLSEDSCVIINLNLNNDTTQNKGSLQRDDSPATVEGQSKNPLGDPYYP